MVEMVPGKEKQQQATLSQHIEDQDDTPLLSDDGGQTPVISEEEDDGASMEHTEGWGSNTISVPDQKVMWTRERMMGHHMYRINKLS